MPAVVVGRPKRSEAMWEALKTHIIRERQKKKQEQEADAEVERQRKERERKQKQDVMTLGETRDQISQLELRLAQLKDEKHQLFLQLKKVLNEDDNRRRQLVVKESNDNMMSMHGYPTVALSGHQQLFLQQNLPLTGRAPIYKVPPTHGTQHSLLPPGALKRSRSPSPPPPNYHQGYGYKPGTIPAYAQQKVDDGRRGHEYVRAVLWNKNTQYTGSQAFYAPHGPQQVPAATTVSYSPSPQQTVYTYAGPQYAQPPPGTAAAPPRDEAGKQSQHSVYLGQPPRASLATLPQHSQAYVTPLHQSMEHAQKPGFPSVQEAAEKYYSVAPIRPATHVPIHGGAIPIQQPPQGAKTGGITSGYPIRAQPVAASPHAPAHATTGSYQPNVSTPHFLLHSLLLLMAR
ncbi:G protein pathway suppressor 2 isoform X2 [Periplaneta americana]|uniref:G protein pathway suppressor 2 isoform X2 n=1 Tax=Periplaneta americana TaxID=6978 RepID=UPI0037E7E329